MSAKRDITLNLNGRDHAISVEPRRTLADAIRDDCGQTGTHLGCEHGICGTCTVLLDGEPVRACLVLAVQVDGRELTTVEGLAGDDGELHPLQEAFRDAHGLQCGFCTPGILMTMVPFLAENPDPDEREIRYALSGNLCRCTGYQRIVDAVADAQARRRGQ